MIEKLVGSASVDGDFVVLRIHRDNIHSLRVALQPIQQGATTPLSTQNVRDQFDKALAKVQGRTK